MERRRDGEKASAHFLVHSCGLQIEVVDSTITSFQICDGREEDIGVHCKERREKISMALLQRKKGENSLVGMRAPQLSTPTIAHLTFGFHSLGSSCTGVFSMFALRFVSTVPSDSAKASSTAFSSGAAADVGGAIVSWE